MAAYAYIRKSVVQPGAKTLSWEMQEQAVRELADKYGDPDVTILSDWNKSGRKGKEGRPGYRELIEAIESGQATVVYAYSLSRLSRSTQDYAALAALCVERKVQIRLSKEGVQDFASPMGRFMSTLLAAVAQMEAELAQERSRDMVRARVARGDVLGPSRYGANDGEDLAAVVEAYETGGSLHAAARALNAAGVPTRHGGEWLATSVRAILTKVPGVLPATKTAGAKRASRFLFARLLRCHCGTLLTPHAPNGHNRYWCHRAADNAAHGSPKGVSERLVIDWIKAEVEGAGPEDREIALVEGNERRDSLLEDLRRNLTAYRARAIDDEEFAATKRKIDDELRRLDSEGRVKMLTAPDWATDDPGLVNEWLRTLLGHVQLDEQMRPVAAVWLLPSWRRSRQPDTAPAEPALQVA